MVIAMCNLSMLAVCEAKRPVMTGESQSDSEQPLTAPRTQADSKIEWGIEAVGFAIGSFMDEPSENEKVMAINGVQSRVPYSGFAGIGSGGGLTVNALWNGIIGIQVGFWKASEKVEGSLNIIDYRSGSGNQYELEINKDVLHIPVALKVVAPTSSVRPYALIGLNFVMPSTAELDSQIRQRTANSDSYKTLHMGIGLDISLPVKGQDIRIPFTLRGNHNLDLGSKVSDRLNLSNCANVGGGFDCVTEYRTDWQWQALVTLGVAYYFR